MRILLVEDDENLAQVVAQALTGQHYLVDIANDEGRHPALILRKINVFGITEPDETFGLLYSLIVCGTVASVFAHTKLQSKVEFSAGILSARSR